jgi:hypothetical protein
LYFAGHTFYNGVVLATLFVSDRPLRYWPSAAIIGCGFGLVAQACLSAVPEGDCA